MGTLDISDMMSEGLRPIMSSAPRPSFAYVYRIQYRIPRNKWARLYLLSTSPDPTAG